MPVLGTTTPAMRQLRLKTLLLPEEELGVHVLQCYAGIRLW